MKMATVTYKTKLQALHNMDDTIDYHYVIVPKIKRNHCNMQEFSRHLKYNGFSNSDLFLGMVNGAIRQMARRFWTDRTENHMFVINELPDNVTVNTSGFLAIVTIEL